MSDISNIARPREPPRTTQVDKQTITTGKPLLKSLRDARSELGTSSDQQTIQQLYNFWRANR